MDKYGYGENANLDYGDYLHDFVYGDLLLEEEAVKEIDATIRRTDSAEALRILYINTHYVSYPICGVGIVANIIVLWVWSMESGYNATTYFFKALAVSDIITLAFFPIKFSVHGFVVKNLLATKIMYGTKRLGIFISMQLAVVRTIKLFSPLRAEKLLSHSRMRAVLAGFTVWSYSVGYVSNVVSFLHFDDVGEMVELYQHTVNLTFSGILPVMLQVVLMIVLVWKISRTTSVSHSSTVSTSTMLQERRSTKQLVYTVFLICVVSFIAYPVSALLTILVNLNRTAFIGLYSYRRVVFSTFGVASRINSTINLAFYMSCLKSFRSMFSRRLSNARQQFTNTSFFFSLIRSTVGSQTRTSENKTVHSSSLATPGDNRGVFGAKREVETSSKSTTFLS